ncbi:uncharacterized protein LOC128681846 isoform X2 [Plodia interpunctella]|uniref:uncharacterized protein LOC128681846 isoform X2 n=1 Tax=Plodia interpunctella TaxID=58824 RepID=UPI003100E9B9
MEAVVFDGKSLTLKYDNKYPMPKLVNDTDVIVKVEYSGVCGTDLHIIQGEFPALKERPLPLGHEFSGEIFQAGKASVFKKGQKVVVDPNRACNLCDFCRSGNYQYCLTAGINSTIGIFRNGGWAQYCLAPQDQVYALPDGITTEQAGLCEPYSCVAHGFDRASPLKVGQKILISGAGIIDTGYRLVTPDVLAAEKPQFDVIVDCTGVGKVMEINFNYLRHGGKYIIFGCCPPTHQASVNPFVMYDKELTIIGVKINPFSFNNAIGWLQAMGSRYLEYSKLGVKTYALSEYQKALEDLKTGSIAKAIFKIK